MRIFLGVYSYVLLQEKWYKLAKEMTIINVRLKEAFIRYVHQVGRSPGWVTQQTRVLIDPHWLCLKLFPNDLEHSQMIKRRPTLYQSFLFIKGRLYIYFFHRILKQCEINIFILKRTKLEPCQCVS